MSSSSPEYILRGLSIYKLLTFLPKQWKNVHVSNGREFMINSIFDSLKSFASHGQLSKAFEAFSLVQLRRSYNDSFDLIVQSISILLVSCTTCSSLPSGKQLHGCIISSGLEEDSILVPKLVTFYSSFKLLAEAHTLVENSNLFHPCPWNLLITSYVRNELHESAILAYKQMLSKGVRPDNFTFPSILKACGETQNLGFGLEVHKCINSWSNQWSLFVQNALISMYGRCGELDTARNLFDNMLDRDAVSWNSMISCYASKGMWKEAFELFDIMQSKCLEINIVTWNIIAGGCLRLGYGMQGEGRKALRLFEEMKSVDIKPDHITMVAVLSACSHSGLVKQGEVLFAEMQSVHGLSPRLEHYACMADLFGRVGLLDRAKEIITRMPCRPTSAMWATLIGACCIHRNTDIGEWAAEKLLEMKPEHSGYYVLIANMYAAAGSWSKLAKIRTLMRDYGVAKAPGCSWVEVGSEFVSFLVGDTSNPQALESKHLLDSLNDVMKHGTLVMTDDYDIGDDIF
ncbi:pentatricopeptide repeat-containing protein At1g71490 isoform X2 [Cucurbita pepo subsp. pepo]|uniref:pentatricopeptide repeat-containing protein At1g71490 isoform X2 n=1 Tax=Cucurbita pepo subsp. pepo TaxID=3664 RepID=UPI000C9D4E18|nr:pentatricopeptide repeat-containing protein At1g71490 isoform X2 [Cucurbita pepo subsp. pepo]